MKNMIWLLLVLLLLPLLGFAQQNWQHQDSHFPTDVSVVSLSAVNDQVCWAVGEKIPLMTVPYAGFIRTTNGGTSWVCDSIPGTEHGFFQQIKALDANTAYVTAFFLSSPGSQGVYKTTDGGASWTHQNVYGSSTYGPGYIHFWDANNGVVIGDPNLETYTTTDGGLNWNSVSMPPALSGEGTWFSDAGIVSAGNRVWFSTGAHLFRSTDRGHTWTAFLTEPQFNSWYPCIAFQDSNIGIYSLKVQGGLVSLCRKTTDGGVTWNTLSNSVIDNIAPTRIQYLSGSGATYLLAGGMPQGMRGFAVTYNAGVSWTLIDTSGHLGIAFPSASVGWGSGVGYATNDVYKYVGPPIISSVTYESTGPASYLLTQNYPNPFNPSTSISYQLPTQNHVTLKVYDLLGREVATLVNEVRQPGTYSVQWNAFGVASGMYICRLQDRRFHRE